MVRVPGLRQSWGRRLICAFGAVAVGLLAVTASLYLLSEFDAALPRLPEWLVLTGLLLVFLVVGYGVYRHLLGRDRYVVWSALYALPVVGFVAVILLFEQPRHGYPGDDSAMVSPSIRAPSEVAAADETELSNDVAESEMETDTTQTQASDSTPVARREASEREARRRAQWERELERLQEEKYAALASSEVRQRAEEMARRRAAEMEARQQAETQLAETAAEPAMPRFPWPPPKTSGMEVLPTVFLRDQVTLGDVAVALDRALSWVGRHEIRFYSVPNGFAMVTRLEEVDERGNTIADADRDGIDFLTYMRNLFWVPPGNYRMIVFVVTDQPFESSGDPMDRRQARGLESGGFNYLPYLDSNRPYTEHYRTTALIYEFRKERQNEEARVLSPGRFPAHYHLDRIGWFGAAQEMPQMADVAVLFPSPTAAGFSGR